MHDDGENLRARTELNEITNTFVTIFIYGQRMRWSERRGQTEQGYAFASHGNALMHSTLQHPKEKSRMNLFIVLSPPLAAYIVDIVVVAVASLILVSIRECERLIVVRNAYAYVPTPEEQQSAIKPITNEMEEREKQ